MAAKRKSHSRKERDLAVSMVAKGRPVTEVSERLDIPRRTIYRWLENIRKDPITGQILAAFAWESLAEGGMTAAQLRAFRAAVASLNLALREDRLDDDGDLEAWDAEL